MIKEVLALDLDDVVVDVVDSLQGFYNQTRGTHLTRSDYYSTDLSIHGAPDMATAIRWFREYLESDKFFELPPTAEALRAIQTLDDYYDIYAVTGRHAAMK